MYYHSKDAFGRIVRLTGILCLRGQETSSGFDCGRRCMVLQAAVSQAPSKSDLKFRMRMKLATWILF